MLHHYCLCWQIQTKIVYLQVRKKSVFQTQVKQNDQMYTLLQCKLKLDSCFALRQIALFLVASAIDPMLCHADCLEQVDVVSPRMRLSRRQLHPREENGAARKLSLQVLLHVRNDFLLNLHSSAILSCGDLALDIINQVFRRT